jgi:hypothetical protein
LIVILSTLLNAPLKIDMRFLLGILKCLEALRRPLYFSKKFGFKLYELHAESAPLKAIQQSILYRTSNEVSGPIFPSVLMTCANILTFSFPITHSMFCVLFETRCFCFEIVILQLQHFLLHFEQRSSQVSLFGSVFSAHINTNC